MISHFSYFSFLIFLISHISHFSFSHFLIFSFSHFSFFRTVSEQRKHYPVSKDCLRTTSLLTSGTRCLKQRKSEEKCQPLPRRAWV